MVQNALKKELKSKFNKYMEILNIIEAKLNENNIAAISQKEIAELTASSQTNISNRIKQLVEYGAISKVKGGQYSLLKNDINYTPYRPTIQVLNLYFEQPELKKEYKKQAELLHLDYKEVQMAWGYIKADSNLFSNKKGDCL